MDEISFEMVNHLTVYCSPDLASLGYYLLSKQTNTILADAREVKNRKQDKFSSNKAIVNP